jgi:hypothetical protein
VQKRVIKYNYRNLRSVAINLYRKKVEARIRQIYLLFKNDNFLHF